MARYSDTLRDQNLRPIPGALVSVLAYDGSAATLTNDDSSHLANPFETDTFGGYVFNATPGRYTVRFTYGGRTVADDRDVVVGTIIAAVDPSPANAGKFVALDGAGVPVFASGTGNDSAFRTDVAASGGSALVGFLQSGTGAVSRTAQAKLREIVTPEDFGAVGDGTTDDTAAVQRALNRRGRIKLRSTYLVSSALTIYADTHLVGEPSSKLKWAGPTTGNMLQDSSAVTSTDVNLNITLEGFEIDGGDLASGDSAQVAINFYRTGNVTMRGLKVHGVGGSGIRWGNSFADTVGVLIENCQVWDCRVGDAIQGSGRRIIVQGCHVGKANNSAGSNFGDTGIALIADFNSTTNPSGLFSSGVQIINNTIVGNYNGSGTYQGVGGQIQSGIALGPFAIGADANVQVRGNNVTGCYVNLWAIVMANVTVDGNTFGPHAATATGNVRFDGITNGAILNNNISRAYTQTGADYSNILLVAQRNTYGASKFDADVTDVTVSGNTLSSTVGGTGVRVSFEQINTSPSYTSKVTRAAVQSNTFVGVATRVSLAPVTGTTVSVCTDVAVQANKSDNTAGSLLAMGGIASQYSDVRLLNNAAPSVVAPSSGTGADDLIVQHKVSAKITGAASGSATTVLAIPATGYGRIDLNAWVKPNSGGNSALSATMTVTFNNGVARVSNQSDGGNLVLTLSGLNIQANQTTGGANDIRITGTYS